MAKKKVPVVIAAADAEEVGQPWRDHWRSEDAAASDDDDDLLTPQSLADESVASVLSIDPTNIKTDFVKLPGYFAYYGEHAAEALRDQLRAKESKKRTHAKLFLAFKEESDGDRADGVKSRKYTEAQLNALVETHVEATLASDRLIAAEYKKASAYAKLDALRAKRDALVSITGHVRDERRAMGLSGAADDDDV